MKHTLKVHFGAQTPEETARAVAGLADRLEEMDRAEGVFGEVMDGALSVDDLERITGGMAHIVPTSCPPIYKQEQGISDVGHE